MSIYVRRPKVGDVIEWRTGPVEVRRVFRDGVKLEVYDALGRDWTIERAESGWWTRNVA